MVLGIDLASVLKDVRQNGLDTAWAVETANQTHL
jgi:hypothetical protein